MNSQRGSFLKILFCQKETAGSVCWFERLADVSRSVAGSACHDSARRVPVLRMSRAVHAGRFCLTSTRPAEFVTITSASRRHVASPGAPDFMLEHEEALPAQSQLAAPSPDSEAEAIQSRLLSLARRADVRPSQASILLSAHEFGVGSTINGASTERPACPDHCTALRPPRLCCGVSHGHGGARRSRSWAHVVPPQAAPVVAARCL